MRWISTQISRTGAGSASGGMSASQPRSSSGSGGETGAFSPGSVARSGERSRKLFFMAASAAGLNSGARVS